MAPNRRMSSRNPAERSAFFALREAAAVLRRVLQGDADRRATASIKSLVFGPSVRNKKATFALVCQTLKYLPILKQITTASNILNNKWKKQEELIFVTSYDILFGQEVAMTGTAEKFLMRSRNALQSSLAKLLVREKTKNIDDLLPNKQNPGHLVLGGFLLQKTAVSIVDLIWIAAIDFTNHRAELYMFNGGDNQI